MTASSKFFALALALIGLFGVAPGSAEAGLTIQVINSTAPVGGSGSFDVTLAASGGNFQIAFF